MRDIRIQGDQNQLSTNIGSPGPGGPENQNSARWMPWNFFVVALGSVGTVVAAVVAIIALK